MLGHMEEVDREEVGEDREEDRKEDREVALVHLRHLHQLLHHQGHSMP